MRYFEKEFETGGFTATLQCYVRDVSEDCTFKRYPAVIICPGGAYTVTCGREAEPVALRFLGEGFNAYVLHYSCRPAREPVQITQMAMAMKFIKDNAIDHNTDSNKITVLGSSAGGHLAAHYLAMHHTQWLSETTGIDNETLKPANGVLMWPVINAFEYQHADSFKNLLGERYEDEKERERVSVDRLVTPHFPRTFLLHTRNDTAVTVENSLLLAKAMADNKVQFEMHVYETGPHGTVFANELTMSTRCAGRHLSERSSTWFRLALNFLNEMP